MERVLKSKTVYDFDSQLVVKIFGFKNAEEYYQVGSSNQFVENVSIPLLSINAEDDPLSLSTSIPVESVKKNPNLFFVR